MRYKLLVEVEDFNSADIAICNPGSPRHLWRRPLFRNLPRNLLLLLPKSTKNTKIFYIFFFGFFTKIDLPPPDMQVLQILQPRIRATAPPP